MAIRHGISATQDIERMKSVKALLTYDPGQRSSCHLDVELYRFGHIFRRCGDVFTYLPDSRYHLIYMATSQLTTITVSNLTST